MPHSYQVFKSTHCNTEKIKIQIVNKININIVIVSQTKKRKIIVDRESSIGGQNFPRVNNKGRIDVFRISEFVHCAGQARIYTAAPHLSLSLTANMFSMPRPIARL